MNSIKFMFAAYAATWAIHIFYLGTLIRRYGRVRRESSELSEEQRQTRGL